METTQERAYRAAFRKVEALQIELARHVYSVQRRQEAERKLHEAMAVLDRARDELLKARCLQRQQSAGAPGVNLPARPTSPQRPASGRKARLEA